MTNRIERIGLNVPAAACGFYDRAVFLLQVLDNVEKVLGIEPSAVAGALDSC